MANLLDKLDASRKTGTRVHEKLPKSNGLYYWVLGTWLCLNLVLWRDLLAVADLAEKPVTTMAAVLLGCAISVGWLFGSYHLGFVIFSLLHSTSKDQDILASTCLPSSSVAILHTVCDDFQERAALSCVRQSYSNYHVFILDDSMSLEQKNKIDKFAATFVEKVTVIRRQNRTGFKAGNINNALDYLSSQYKYLALADSDTYLPPDFVATTCMLLEANPSSAFVQTLHVANSDNKGAALSQQLEALVWIGWKYYQPIRNKYGFPMCYGHGALISCNAIKEAGGFPEIVSEDIALTLNLRRQGHRGYFTPSVICGEDYPEDYHSFRKRLSRWVSADLECSRTALVPFLNTKGINLVEKVDAALRGLKVPAAAIFLPFAVITGILSVFWPRWNELFTDRIAYITVFLALAPYLSFSIELVRQPKKLALLLSRMTFLYCSNSLLLTVRAIEALLTRKSEFFVTGAKDKRVSSDNLRRQLLTMDKVGYPLLAIIEVGMGLSLSIIGLIYANLILVGVSLALLLAPVVYASGWRNPLVSYLVHVPFALIMAGIAVSCFSEGVPASQCVALAGLSILLF